MKALCCGLIWLLHVAAVQAAETITLFCYQQQPPYVVNFDQQQGLYFDLAQRLQALMPDYEFAIRDIPRRRLDRLLANDQLNGLVLGVSTSWFASSTHYSFSRAFLDDANLLVSRRTGEVSQLSLETLPGHRLGLVTGHQYPELAETLQAGKVSRENSVSESTNLERLLRGWIDATVVGERTLAFLTRQNPALAQQVVAARPALYRYRRHLLVPTRYQVLLPRFNQALEALERDLQWQGKLASYRLKSSLGGNLIGTLIISLVYWRLCF